MIELNDVSIQAGTFSLTKISFQLDAGQYGVLMGRTGQGKTTILEVICGLRRIDAGKIIVGGHDMTRWPPQARDIGYVPQDLALFPNLNVRKHLEFALRLRKQPRDLIIERTREMAKLLGIEHLLERSVVKLSGGESQRVALGRALVFQPRVLLLDEPLSALDEATRNDMQTLLRSIQQTTGVTTLHVTHSQDEAASLADRTFQLTNEGIVES